MATNTQATQATNISGQWLAQIRLAQLRFYKRFPAFEAWLKSLDMGVVTLVAVLLLVGVLFSFCSSPEAAHDTGKSDPLYYFLRQMVMAPTAFTVMLAISTLPRIWIRRLGALGMVVGLLMLVLVALFGDDAKGAARWLIIGPIRLQPSEFFKPMMVIFTAWMFAIKISDPRFFAGKIVLAVTGFVALLLIGQPDIGQTILLCATIGAMAMLAGVKWRDIMGLAALGAVAMFVLYKTVPHMADRINAKMGLTQTDGCSQVCKALDAIAEGGILGQGPLGGTVKSSLPDSHTDFIYALGAEEFGMFASLGVIALFAFLILRGLDRASQIKDPFANYGAMGLYILLGLQAVINLCVNLDIGPTKGMTLPFVSYGGSSLLASAICMGLALGLTRRRPGERLVH